MLQTSVEIVNPGGTGNPALVISARPAPLPPSRSFISRLPSALPLPKKYTYFPRLFRAARTGVRALVFEVPTFDGFTAVFTGIEFFTHSWEPAPKCLPARRFGLAALRATTIGRPATRDRPP